MIYFVNEIQNNVSTTYAFDNIEQAYSKYHMILSYASVSEVERHGAIMYNNLGDKIESKVFIHAHTTEQE